MIDGAQARPLQWRFLQLTLFLFVWMLVAPHMQDRWIVQVLVQLALANSLLMALWASPEERRARRAMITLWVVSLAGSALALVPLSDAWHQLGRTAEIASRAPLLALLSVSILRFVFSGKRLTTDGMFATIAVYLLIAFLFAQLYLLVITWNPASFNVTESAEGGSYQHLQAAMVYFSLVTLATLGYGDVLPLTETARSLAVIEAVIGQFYVGVIVAVFVGMYSSQRRT